MARDERVLLIGEDVATYGGAFGVTSGLKERFGAERVLDTPISETGFTGAACGAALMGFRPVVEFQFIDFIACAFDMIVNFAAPQRYRTGMALPLVLRGPCGGGVRGGPFHSQNPEAFFFNTPGLKIVAPATAHDAKGLLKAAIRDDDPVIFLEHKYPLPAHQGGSPRGGLRGADRQGHRPPPGDRSHHPHLRRDDAPLARGRARAGGAKGSRPRSSTCAACFPSTRSSSSPRPARPGRS